MSTMKAPNYPILETIAFEVILPSRPTEEQSLSCRKFAAIRTSIQEVGLIEPLLVYPIEGSTPQQYLLLDGHLRLAVLKSLKQRETLCLITHNPENFTIDSTVSALVPIQEHYMILHAVDRGVPEERIAQIFHVDIKRIRDKRSLLDGICQETINLLQDKDISEQSLRLLRKVKPTRQVHIATMMNALGNYTVNFLRAMINTTPAQQRVVTKAEKLKETIDPGDLAALERELDTLHRQIERHGTSYGESFTRLTQIRGYLNRLLDSPRVVRYLSIHFPDQLRGFHKVLEFTALEEPDAALDAASFPEAVPAS